MTATDESMTYVGLDVSLAETHVCVLCGDGKTLFQGAVPSEPATIAECLEQHAPNCQRVAVETGATTPWLWRELRHRDVPVICVDARHANQALSMPSGHNLFRHLTERHGHNEQVERPIRMPC